MWNYSNSSGWLPICKEVYSFMEFAGKISVDFEAEQLNRLCREFFPTFDHARLEVLAVRLFVGKEIMLTLYALDKGKDTEEKQPVKKYKKELVDVSQLLQYAASWNFTVSKDGNDLGNMEVINR